MATHSTKKVILSKPEDWDDWVWELRSKVDQDIWPCIDPMVEKDELEPLVEKPTVPTFNLVKNNARRITDLNPDQQKTYHQLRQYFSDDLKQYTRQQDHLKEIRIHIVDSVSRQKALLLDPALTVREWLVKLKKDTAPTKGYMINQVTTEYTEALRPLRGKTFSQWLDRWELAMERARRYKITSLDNGQWLRDLAGVIQQISPVHYVRFLDDAEDEEESDPERFMSVARKLREAYGTQKISGHTVKGGAFAVSFNATESSEDSVGTEEQGDSTTGRKRSRSGSTGEGDAPPPKKAPSVCPACGIRGHNLPRCWAVFPEMKPDGAFSPPARRLRKVKKAMEKDPDLVARVEEIRQQRKEETKKEASPSDKA